MTAAIRLRWISSIVVTVLMGLFGWENAALAADWRFSITLDPAVTQQPFTGTVYVFFSQKQEPRLGPDWFHPEPFVAVETTGWQPGTALLISPATPRLRSFPVPLAELPIAGQRAQAVVRLNPWEREVGVGPGNAYSAEGVVPAETNPASTLSLAVVQVIPEPTFATNDFCKELVVRSPVLSQFYGREVFVKGSVLLPASYHQAPLRRYPVIFNIPGFGGTHYEAARKQPIAEQNERSVEFLRVTLNPSCPLGHHVFADSANNGPWGQALTTEFLVELDRQYRTVAQPTARFLTGHSSGGWSSLWLQVAYPETFGGVWSTAPDPVTFTDFQQVDLYQPGANLFRNQRGERRPLARDENQVALWYDSFHDMEEVLGPGGQLHSFEAVFSPRGQNGRPRLLWDRRTGVVQAEVAQAWKPYDIRLKLKDNWTTLGPQLTGKLHVFMGEEDTFYLEGATRLLKVALAELGSDAVVELLPGKNHFNLLDVGLTGRMRAEMTASFLKHHQP